MTKFVTTMAQSQIGDLGEKLFESWTKFSKDEKLIVFVDSTLNLAPAWLKEWRNVEFHQIENPNYKAFLDKHRGNPAACGVWNDGYEYRLDAVRFCHKIYAIEEGLKYLTPEDELYIWWDADAWLTAQISEDIIKEAIGPIDWLAASLGRKDWDHTETGFIAFNMTNSETRNFINTMTKLYDTGHVFKLAQGRTDSFVYDVVKDAFSKQKGQKFKNISEGVPGNHVWPHTTLAAFSEHAKGPVAKSKLGAVITPQFQAPQGAITQTPQGANINTNQLRNRYDQIYKLIELTRPKIIAEIGVAQGERAETMILEAAKTADKVIYFGFDIFEDGDEELNKKEMNGKRVSSLDEVTNRLKRLQERVPNLFFTLYKGNTNDTLPAYVNKPITLKNKTGLSITVTPSMAELVFIDGGHSVETIRNDYTAFKNNKLILLDDYYIPDEQGKCPDTTKFGCNFLESSLDVVRILPVADPVTGGGRVKIMATGPIAERINVTQENKMPQGVNPAATQNQVKNQNGKGIKIETRNSIPNEVLQAQADYACRMMKEHNIPESPTCTLHDKWGYLIGGAASYKTQENIEEIRRASLNNGVIFTSKTAHDYLITQGIVPWACILLDPRPHVADFFEIHPDVNYFVASQCHQAVFDKLIKAGAKMWVYHAEVAAGERDVIKRHFPNARMLAGGSTSQSRGISILMNMGFYKFKLFGLDSSYPVKPERVHGINQEKQPIEISVNNNITNEKIGQGKYWTDPELLAQINDMEHITKIFNHLVIDCKSEGLMRDMLEHWLPKKQDISEIIR